jgi:hypothetical protein
MSELDPPNELPANVNHLKKWPWKDILTISFSAAAFVFSSVTVYFNFFRVDTTVLATIVGERNRIFSVAIMNAGNRQIGISTAYLYMSHPNLGNGRVGHLTDQLPVIEPGDVRVVEFTYDPEAYNPEIRCEEGRCDRQDLWVDLLGMFRIPAADGRYEVKMGARLEAMSATGDMLVANVNGITAHVSTNGRELGVSEYSIDSETVAFEASRE